MQNIRNLNSTSLSHSITKAYESRRIRCCEVFSKANFGMGYIHMENIAGVRYMDYYIAGMLQTDYYIVGMIRMDYYIAGMFHMDYIVSMANMDYKVRLVA